MEIKPEETYRGYKWIVLYIAFMVGVIIDGISFSFGLLFTELLEYFDQGKSPTSMIISVYNGAYLSIGPVANVLMSRYGTQKACVCGSLVASVAVFLATFAPNVYLMILLFGLTAGSGLGVIYFASIVTISQYFRTKRAVAFGVAYCGSGVGAFIFAPLMEFLISKYSWQGSLWILSGIVLNCVPFGALLKPPGIDETVQNHLDSSQNNSNFNETLSSGRGLIHAMLRSLKLLKSPSFIFYGSSCFLCLIGFYIPFTFLPDYVGGKGITPQDGAILIAIIGILNTVGRATGGCLIDRLWIEPLKFVIGWLIIAGFATILVPMCVTFVPMSIFCGLFGIMLAFFKICQPILSQELSEPGQMASFYGMVSFSQGTAAFIGAPIAGMLVDITGNYDGAFYMAGVTILTAGVICLPLFAMKRRKKSKKQNAVVEGIVESTHL